MCLHPIQIVNPTKYISLEYRDPYLLSVPCGKCAECQQTLSNQWFLRCWYECQNVGSFVYFDTLTYSDEFVPMMSDFVSVLPPELCFNPKDIRLFIEALRIKMKRVGVSFRYFIASEYGSERYTHRPHYHVLFFVDGDIKPEEFSLAVYQVWKKGRTDGVPFKSVDYVRSHNTIISNSIPADFLRACHYVTKYVQKSCLFDRRVERLLNSFMLILAENYFDDDWLQSVNAHRLKIQLRRHLSQFHRQSQGFGAQALQDIDLQQLFEDGCLYMPSTKGLKLPVPLPMYYKRKLFYDLVVIDGARTWQLNELGVQYRNYRKSKLMKDLSSMFFCASQTYNLKLDKSVCDDLADYVYNIQGRIKADAKQSDNLLERLPSVTLFNYVTMSDYERLNHRGLINKFIGNNSIGYSVDSLPPSYSIKDFIGKYVYYDDIKEKQLNLIYYHLSKLNNRRQNAFELQQHLNDVYKDIRSMMV